MFAHHTRHSYILSDSPLRRKVAHLIGLEPVGAVYGLGLAGFVIALFNYKNTPIDQPVTTGLYRISRHPQRFMVSVAFLGTSIAMGSWPAFALMAVGVIGSLLKLQAEEEACLERYGEPYRAFTAGVPRYLLFC